MSDHFPLFAAFIAPHLDMLRAALIGHPYEPRRHRTVLEWETALWIVAPAALALLHDLFAKFLLADMESCSPEEVFWEDFLRLVALHCGYTPADLPAAK
jgi:hypothetical protein